MIVDNFAVRLIKARNTQNLTAKQLADKMNCSPSVVCYIESERNSPTAYTIWRLCKALNCSADYLLGLSDDPALKGK